MEKVIHIHAPYKIIIIIIGTILIRKKKKRYSFLDSPHFCYSLVSIHFTR